MTKHRALRKLSLNRETVRSLSADQLGRAGGGAATSATAKNCSQSFCYDACPSNNGCTSPYVCTSDDVITWGSGRICP